MDKQKTGMVRRIVEFIFYGNYFYGICAVASYEFLLKLMGIENLNIQSEKQSGSE